MTNSHGKNKITLCIIITGLSGGGAETWLYRLLACIDRSRFSIHVISLGGVGVMGPLIKGLGIPVTTIHMRPGLAACLRFPRLVKALRAIRPDVVHTMMYHADLAGGLAARFAGKPSVLWGIHHGDLSFRHNKLRTLAIARACALFSRWLPNHILVCSEWSRQIHSDFGYCSDRMSVITNGFDVERFTPNTGARSSVRSELGLSSEALIVGIVARDDPIKNLQGFLASAARVREVLPGVHFVLAGEGIDESNDALVQSIAEHQLEGAAHLLGRRTDVPRLMSSFDVVALSSHGEAFPNVLGEAMACGVPCVSTDAGDAAEIIGSTGHVVPLGDMIGLADGLVTILKLPRAGRRALGRAARERVVERYTVNGIVKKYENVFTRADTTRSDPPGG